MSAKKQTSMDSFLKGKRKVKEVDEKVTPAKKNNSTGKKAGAKKAATKAKKSVEETKEEVKEIAAKTGDVISDPLTSYDDFVGHLGDWKEPLQKYLKTSNFKQIFEYVKKEYSTTKCYPPKELIFNAFKKAQFKNIKVVIVGQDPYIKENEAMGLCFSIPKPTKTPPSLKNIYKALKKDSKVDFKDPDPMHGDLQSWADQGILMLNVVLTVRAGVSFSHAKSGWTTFTNEVISAINKDNEGVIFLAWGGKAQAICKNVNRAKHHVLEYGHPSPLAQKFMKFEDCDHFSRVNEILGEQGKDAIDWNLS